MKLENGKLIYQGRKYDCRFPSSVLSVRADEGLICNPLNGRSSADLSRTLGDSCEFTTVFDVSLSDLTKDVQIVRLPHVDTIGEVFLNDEPVGSLSNSHRVYDFDVKGKIHVGLNELKIKLVNPITYIEGRQKEYPLWTLGGPSFTSGYGHIRRPYCTLGWDWAPKIPDMGIDGVPEFIATDGEVLGLVVSQRHYGSYVNLEISVKTLGNPQYSVTILDPNGSVEASGLEGEEIFATINNPRLWWPNGMGEHPLYKIQVIQGDKVAKAFNLGLRMVELVRRPDEHGESFYFTVNGEPVFLSGANAVPTSLVLPYSDMERRGAGLIEHCVSANMNSIRIWGGGVYPGEGLLNAADEKGILVFEDFMFSSTAVRLDEEFKENVLSEIDEQIRNLNTHPSVFLWCGNNECEHFLNLWANDTKMAQNPNKDAMLKDYAELFERLIPNKLHEMLPNAIYWPSSPSKGGSFKELSNDLKGDSHSWDVWAGKADLDRYFDVAARFCDEYGFASMPSLDTMVFVSQDRNWNEKDLSYHSVKPDGFNAIKSELAKYYHEPKGNLQLIHASQALQADAVDGMLNHLRSNAPVCMGSYAWCLNDPWPSIALSSVDYQGDRKLVHYKMARTNSPVSIVYDKKFGRVTFRVVNNTLKNVEVRVEITCKTATFKELGGFKGKVVCPANDNVVVASYDYENVLRKGTDFISYGFEGNVIDSVPLKRINKLLIRNGAVKVSVKGKGEGVYELELSSNHYKRDVAIYHEGKLLGETQCFDMTSADPVRIEVTSKTEPKEEDIQAIGL